MATPQTVTRRGSCDGGLIEWAVVNDRRVAQRLRYHGKHLVHGRRTQNLFGPNPMNGNVSVIEVIFGIDQNSKLFENFPRSKVNQSD
jgi:hypothetical protein